MQLNVTFRHMEATDAIREYAREKIDRIHKYFPDPISAHIVLSVERGYQHAADVTIQLHNGIVLKGREATEDMYSSIDLVAAKIERQVRKYKEKIRSHKPQPSQYEQIPIVHQILDAASLEARAEAAEAIAAERAGAGTEAAARRPAAAAKAEIIEESKFFANPLTVEQAVMQMDLLNEEFLVFRNADTRAINVMYRRKDGNFGLIETPSRE